MDRFGNPLTMPLDFGYRFSVEARIIPHRCSGHSLQEFFEVPVEEQQTSKGIYKAFYTPSIAGEHVFSISLRARGGLLATYFHNADFTDPYFASNYGMQRSHEQTLWCVYSTNVECDSSSLTASINFDWGLCSPFSAVSTFPIDSFSVKFTGVLLAPTTDRFLFFLHYENGSARLIIDSIIVIDTSHKNSNIITGSMDLRLGEFYSVTVEHVHLTDASKIIVSWESSTFSKQPILADYLFYISSYRCAW
jgi:hypothetical protein